jgi:hypothetical protein
MMSVVRIEFKIERVETTHRSRDLITIVNTSADANPKRTKNECGDN